MNPRLAWLASIAADPRISVHTNRFAVAVDALANERGRLRSKMSTMSDACHLTARHMVNHVERLAELGYIEVDDLTRQGRFAIRIVTPADETAPATGKPFREITGHVVGVVAKDKASVTAYVEGDDLVAKIIMPRDSAEAIAAALTHDRHAAPSSRQA